ncbi:MAG: diacylglycerol kinase family lipid kinase [Chloroflexota bacterium]|nr:diacylglycerol kinase family lipid kinase [Chloroflexota bacterium]
MIHSAPQTTLVILNPHAAGGRAGQVWQQIEPLLWERLGELVVAVTQRPEDVAAHLDDAHRVGIRRVIAIGGDGTNHTLVNALARANEQHSADPMIYGNLPIGTGRDWARGVGMPFRDVRAAADWIARATPTPTDLGMITRSDAEPSADGGRDYFLNIASAGLGGDVVRRVNAAKYRTAWTFLGATIGAILNGHPSVMRIRLDGRDWYEGRAYAVAVANGTTFGHGMRIAPHARTDDGLFEIVLVEAVSRARILSALSRVYDGSHLKHPAVRSGRAARVELDSPDGQIEIEADGEYAAARAFTIQMRPALIQMLLQPTPS